jgi:hypothetical protein
MRNARFHGRGRKSSIYANVGHRAGMTEHDIVPKRDILCAAFHELKRVAEIRRPHAAIPDNEKFGGRHKPQHRVRSHHRVELRKAFRFERQLFAPAE